MMKEFKTEDTTALETMKSQIWEIFEILRGDNISSDYYHVVLFLLSAYKDNFISADLLSDNHLFREKLIEQLHDANNELSSQYIPIFHSYKFAIENLSNRGFQQLFGILADINKQSLIANFAEIFDSVLYRISQSQGRYGSEFVQPVELTRLMCGLAELKKESKIFNPFAGLASFGVCIDQGQTYFGQEIIRETWALGALRLKAYEKTSSSKYVCDDSILHWPDESTKFDLIISTPPFAMRLGSHYKGIEGNIRTVEHFLIEKGIQSLSQDGKLIALLPQGFLFRGGHEQRLRENLVEEDLIDTIISLPGGLLQNTGIPLIILLLSKNKKLPGRIKFVDAKHYVSTKGSREKVLNNKGLFSFLNVNKESNNEVKIVFNEQIRHNNYNLNVARYFKKSIDGIKLSEILELVRGKRGNLPETGKLIRIRDLKDDKVDFKLDTSSVEKTELKRPDIHRIDESCLLLAIRWRTLKPTLFEFKDDFIFKGNDILAFKIESVADKAYLINELHADYVQEQLESYRVSASAIPYIRIEDLMNVVIRLPSLEEQRAKIQGIYELSDKIKSLEEERNALTHGKTIKQFNEFASLKHTLGRPRQNILDWSDNLLHFLSTKNEGFDELNKAFADFYDIDILFALKEIKRDINFITDVLEKGENGLILSEYEKKVIPLSDINSTINDLSSNGFNFKIKKSLLKGEMLKERGIYANKTLLKTLLDNILTNANKYAFDKKGSGNEVIIELTEVDDFLSMEIRNNGKPFPKNFDKEKFITKYSTADSSNSSGLGGYDIHRIASDFNNPDWILSLNEDPLFLVKFKFQFPINLIN